MIDIARSEKLQFPFWRPEIYAIIESGGKQYRVSPGQTVEVDYLDAIDGSPVEIDRVLLISDGDKVTTGTPIIEGARVMATSKGDQRGDKVIAFKYKNKTRYHRKIGHVQLYTRLAIDKIVGPGTAEAEPVKKPRARRAAKKEVTTDGA
jgi:large subunit ribosomal protein L21